MTENVKYTIESMVDELERHLEYVDEELMRTERDHVDLSAEKENLVKVIEEHKRALLELYKKG